MHFFCELHSELEEEFSFGPVTGSETTKFNITSKFKLNGSSTSFKAFACQKGSMIVQQSTDANLVNVIIKPHDSLEIDLSPVKYFVYRGIKKSSFFTGTDIIPSATSPKSDFLTRFWQKWADYLTNNGLQDQNSGDPNYVAPPTPRDIGYDSFLPAIDQLADIENVEDLFQNDHPSGVISTTVLAGEWIGDFGNNDIHFEVITDTEHFYKTYDDPNNKLNSNGLNLEYLRKKLFQVEIVNSLDTDTSVLAELQKRFLREEILSYVDPCAFFGMHSSLKKGMYAYIGGSMIRRKKTQIYEDILEASFTANKKKVYLDIRSELGYSYNFHKNYDPTYQVQFKRDIDVSFTDIVYGVSNWPLLIIDSNLGSKKSNKLDIKLRIDDNQNPLIFIQGDIFKRESDFIEVKSGSSDWSKEFRIEFPNVGSGSSKNNIAHHIRINYFRQENAAIQQGQAFPFYSVLDSVFAPIDLPYSVGGIDHFSKVGSAKYGVIQNSDFAYITKPEVFKNGSFYTFYSTIHHRFKASKNVYPGIPDKTEGNGSKFNNSPVFPRKLVIEKVEIIDSPVTYAINLAVASTEELPSYQEDVFILSITEAELESLRVAADIEGIEPNHPRRIVFTNKTVVPASSGVKAHTNYDLQIQGIKQNNTVITTSTGAVKVYTTGGQAFSSKDFGDNSNIPVSLPDAGKIGLWESFMESYDHTTSFVQNVVSTGIVELSDPQGEITAMKIKVKLAGEITYPTDSVGSSTLSTVHSDYPLIVIVHGNGQHRKSYRDLAAKFAKNGFISCAINCTKFTDVALSPIADLGLPAGHAILTLGITLYFKPTTGTTFFGYRPANQKLYAFEKSGGAWTLLGYTPEKYGVDFIIETSPDRIALLGENAEYSDMGAEIRVELILKNLEVLKQKFPTQIANNWALMGHSRGGEAVIMAANKIANDAPTISTLTSFSLNNLNAVVSLAPTDQYPDQTWSTFTIGSNTVDYVSSINSRTQMNNSIPLYVIFGTRDYDIYSQYLSKVSLNTTTNPRLVQVEAVWTENLKSHSGVTIFDRSTGANKVFSSVHGATHNGFISNAPANKNEIQFYRENSIKDKRLKALKTQFNTWDFSKAEYSDTQQDDIVNTKMETEASQQTFTIAFMNAFFRYHLLNETFWLPYFASNYVPASVTVKRFDNQYENYSNKKVILSASYQKNAITNTFNVSGTPTPPPPIVGLLRENDGYDHTQLIQGATSGHDTAGVTFSWNKGDKLTLVVPATDKNASAYSYLSFRIGNASIIEDLKGLVIEVKDTGTGVYSDNLKTLGTSDVRKDIVYYQDPFSDVSGIDDFYDYLDTNFNVMQSIRIPLSDLTTSGVDITEIAEISFMFPTSGSGKITFDSVYYTD